MEHDDLQLIERYFEGILSEAEQKTFEEKRKNPKFRITIDRFQTAKSIIIANQRDRLIRDTQRIMEAHEKRGRSFFLAPRNLRIAAAIAFLAVSVLGLRQWFANSSPEQLFAQHFELPNAPGMRDAGDSSNEQWLEAARAYDSKEFSTAIQSFNDLLGADDIQNPNQVYFFLGNSYIMTENFGEAIASFNRVDSSSSYYQQAVWFIALTHLKAGDTENAKKALEEIAKTGGHYKKRTAEQLLKQF